MRLTMLRAAFVVPLALGATAALAHGSHKSKPIVLKDQGSFAVGGNIVTNPGTFDPIALLPDGQTIHGDHAYAQYQVPEDARKYPLVLWHGGGQFSKTWETTPDGRDGFQNIFLRRNFTTYIIDQPHRGRAGRSTTNGTINASPGSGATGEQGIFIRFRIGIWPNYFPGVQFSHDPEALNQWFRQQTPDTAPTNSTVATDPIATMFNQIGPAVLVTHSASGVLGWITGTKSANVKGIASYEPVGWVFPEGQVPPSIPTGGGNINGTAIPLADFLKLTKIPIQLIWGDYIPEMGSPDPYPGIDIWRGRLEMSKLFVKAINDAGGDAELLHLPKVGIRGNTHFPMSDLNNTKVADLLSSWLRRKRLDKDRGRHDDDDDHHHH
jgi:hypothetical protein